MSVTVYQFRSLIGLFRIVLEASKCELWFNDELRGTYISASAAASNALTMIASDFDSEALGGVDVPADISKWEIVTG